MTEIICYDCDLEFEGKAWEDGKCPKCGREYHWDEMCTPDYSDCWAIIEWGQKKND